MVDAWGRVLFVPVVARVRDGVGPNLITVPAEVVCDALAVGVVDVGDLRGDVVVVADVAGRFVTDVSREAFAAGHELFVDTGGDLERQRAVK